MATPLTIPGDAFVQGGLRVGSYDTLIPRAKLEQDVLASYAIPWTAWRVWDALGTNLPGTAANDDLGLVGGTFGTNSPTIQTGDLKAAGATTRYARCQIWLPPEYDAGQTINLRFHAGMKTTVADVSATLDAEAYKSDTEEGVGSDLVSTAAQSINSLTLADKDFVIDGSALSPGDLLDVRIAVEVNDAATATAVIGLIGAAFLLIDIRG